MVCCHINFINKGLSTVLIDLSYPMIHNYEPNIFYLHHCLQSLQAPTQDYWINAERGRASLTAVRDRWGVHKVQKNPWPKEKAIVTARNKEKVGDWGDILHSLFPSIPSFNLQIIRQIIRTPLSVSQNYNSPGFTENDILQF